MNQVITNFIDDYTEEIINGNAAMFIGAGFSKSSGYVDWRSLLKKAANELELDSYKENELVSIAQYYVNKNGRPAINNILVNEFLQDKKPGENHRIVSRMPINTFWTTNYDSLLEDALTEEGKKVDAKYCNEHMSRTLPNRDVIVYKMHGDKSNPAQSVIIKDDYEKYYRDFAPFITALCGDLISKAFLFLGFSFTDPNIDLVLSRLRVEYSTNSTNATKCHYAFMREVNVEDYPAIEQYQYESKKQKLFFDDLTRRYNIKPIVIKEYSEITSLLRIIETKINIKNIFISGSAEEYGNWGSQEAQRFIRLLSMKLIEAGFNIVSGFGIGVGSGVITGALEQIYLCDKKIDTKRLILRPFPQGITEQTARESLWTKYREDMIMHSGIAIFIFGNKKNNNGEIIDANGMEEEYRIARRENKFIIPIGNTGYVAKKIWEEIFEDFKTFYDFEEGKLKELFCTFYEDFDPEAMSDNVIEFIRLLNENISFWGKTK